MNEWHKKLKAKEVTRRNMKKKPDRKVTGGFSGNSHQRTIQRRAAQPKKQKVA